MKHAQNGNVLSFPVTAQSCARGLPDLQRAAELFTQIDEASSTGAFVQLRLARCEIAMGQNDAAAPRLRALLDAPQVEGVLRNNTRRTLAPLYAQGLGVAQDRERALGLYLMSDLDDRERRAAAELLTHMPGASMQTYYRLLEQGHLPANWLMAVQTRQKRNDNRYDIIRLAIKGVQNTASYMAAIDIDHEQEQQALTRLREIAGTGLAHWGGSDRFAAGWGLLREAHSPAAEKELQKLEPKWPFTLLNADGSPWQDQALQRP